MAHEIVVVRKYDSSVEAEVARLVLEAHGIPAIVLRDDAGGMIPAMHLLFPARLAVHREHAEEAGRVLDAEPAEHWAAEGSHLADDAPPGVAGFDGDTGEEDADDVEDDEPEPDAWRR